MRAIKEMTADNETVWVYLDSEDIWRKFVSMAISEGFHFGNLPVSKWKFGHVVAVHTNGNMGHLPLFIWCRSFSSDAETYPRKIDFSDYISGADDYLCRKSHFTARMIG